MLTQERLKEYLSYNPETGVFHWVCRRQGVNKNGSAGNLNADGYLQVMIEGRQYTCHRLAFLYMTGEWPKGQVDHKKHIRTDNRWLELRDVTMHGNNLNKSMMRTNTSGVTGVYWDTQTGKWRARINNNKKRVDIGYFHTLFDAACARKSAENKYGYHENHGV